MLKRSHKKRSSLENYTSNDTRQHETTRVTTRANTSQHDTTRVQHDTTQDNTSITRPNTSTKEAWAAKIGLYFTFFVTELYISLISFRNG